MRTIPLTQGQVALVDDEDFECLNRYKWQAVYDRKTRSFYAQKCCKDESGRKVTVSMHRAIMGFPKGLHVDHKNNDSLDNRRSNLRLATPSQNRRNQRASICNQTGYKGVRPPHPITGRFTARIIVNHKYHHLGCFSTAEEAHEAYKKAAIELHGEFAKW